MRTSIHVVAVGGFGVAFLAASLLSACDTQAPSDYRGESLLTLQGSVAIGETSVEGELVPAIAFITEGESVSILDVAVEGMFPSSFTLNIFDPPPAAVIGDIAPYAGEVQGTWGSITAVPVDHGTTFPIPHHTEIHIGSDGAGGYGGDVGAGAGGGGSCPVDAAWCTRSGTCRREHYVCVNQAACNDAPATGFEGCTLEDSEGDPELAIDPMERFAGISENYAVLYLEEEAPAGSWAAHQFSDDGAIPAGYSLIEIIRVEESRARDELEDHCRSLARDTATQRVFESLGGSVAREEVEACEWLLPDENPPLFCADYDEQYNRNVAERDCPFDDYVMRRVLDPANVQINVRIAPNLGSEGEQP